MYHSSSCNRISNREAWNIFKAMGNREAVALKRCAQLRMRDRDLEEIGTSDVNYTAVNMIEDNEWPLNRHFECACGSVENVPLGRLIDQFSYDTSRSPAELLGEMKCSRCDNDFLPVEVYDSIYVLPND